MLKRSTPWVLRDWHNQYLQYLKYYYRSSIHTADNSQYIETDLGLIYDVVTHDDMKRLDLMINRRLLRNVFNINSTDINTINGKINNLYNLLKLYSTNQLLSSDTVEVELETVNNLPQLRLNNIDTFYKNIYNINTSDLFNTSGIIPYNIPLPTNKNILVNILNNDTDNSVLSDDNVLNMIIERDLDYKQYITIDPSLYRPAEVDYLCGRSTKAQKILG